MSLKYNLLCLITSLIALAIGEEDEIVLANFCYNATYEDFRLNTTVYMTTVATHWINCAKECVEEPCCRSINFKKIVSTQNERNCEMLHNVVYNTSKNVLQKNTSYDYIYFNNPRKEYNASCLVPKDIDECSERSHTCDGNANCTNTDGSFKCQCKIGFSGDGHTCTDIDECSERSHTCDGNANCTNTDGSFKCQCKIGFSGNEHTCTGEPVFESVILSENYTDILKSWIGGNFTATLCWRATRDGWLASTFHSKCDDKKPTVTIVKVGQYVFGGYATASWEKGDFDGKKAPGSFIFSLQNKENLPPFKAPLKNQNDGWAIYVISDYGPTFGNHDLHISDNAASNTDSYTKFGTSYQPPSGVGNPHTFLAGTYEFLPSEVEVFYHV